MYVCISFNSFWGVDRPLSSSAYAVCPVLIMIMIYNNETLVPAWPQELFTVYLLSLYLALQKADCQT